MLPIVNINSPLFWLLLVFRYYREPKVSRSIWTWWVRPRESDLISTQYYYLTQNRSGSLTTHQFSPSYEGKKSLGILFLIIFAAITSATILDWTILPYNLPSYAFPTIWWLTFVIIATTLAIHFRPALLPLRSRMKTSLSWPMSAKLVNGLCWAGPFALITVFQSMYPYLVLLGIGAGNICTYNLLRKYSHLSNKGQYLVGILSISFIPVALIVNYTIFQNSLELASLVSRLLIGIDRKSTR